MKRFLIRLAFNNTLRKKIWARIAMQLKYGVPLLTIFQNFAKQYKNNTVLSEIFENICAEYHKGLSEALKKYVPYDELMLIESCESGGKLHEGFELAERIISAKDHKISFGVSEFFIRIADCDVAFGRLCIGSKFRGDFKPGGMAGIRLSFVRRFKFLRFCIWGNFRHFICLWSSFYFL